MEASGETAGDGQLAVITGASSGIGYELARQFAENGFDILICAEDADIATAAESLQSTGVAVSHRQVDLADPQGVEDFYDFVRATERPVDAIALNAGVGAGGDFARDTDLEKELKLVDLNVRSTVHLTKLVVKDMLEQGQGRILFTSSIASMMPGTYQAVYNASKSFVQSFALALRAELNDTEIVVTSLMPGPTETEFFERADMEDTKVGSSEKDDPAQVARQGFEALMSGDERVVGGGLSTKAQAMASKVMPDRAKAEMHRRMAEPGSGDDSNQG